ncbi:MAG: MBL fold metallo-hydrolase [Bacteroidota bacterium]
MKIQHFRNATMTIASADKVILVDPLLGEQGSMPTLTLFRFKPKRNPIVPLPEACQQTLDKVTHCIITHQHPDHMDKKGIQFLADKNIPVYCSVKDEKDLRKKGLNVEATVDYWKQTDFLGGSIEGIPARHGYGFVAKPMGNVMGFYIELPGEPSIYLSSDTIYTGDVRKTLSNYEPDINVVAAGSAQLDIFKPLLMTLEDVMRFIKDAPGKVIANHLEAVNHCPTTRVALRNEVEKAGLSDKVFIPADGEIIDF